MKNKNIKKVVLISVFLLMFIYSFILFADKDPAKDNIKINFNGTVKNIEVLGERTLEIFIAGNDPRFGVTVHIDSVNNENDYIKPNKEIVFAVHSPALLFDENQINIIDCSYLFELYCKKDGFNWILSVKNKVSY
ncbi:MAG: hypothetical protein KAI43_05940 [Candidatus Aureabacteria bacterium]|nr:hypothetical protein [Candidatus Auribacterota bacterium]